MQAYWGRLEVIAVVERMAPDWDADSYHVLQKNCCHFCRAFCEQLGCSAPPDWLNRSTQGSGIFRVRFHSAESVGFAVQCRWCLNRPLVYEVLWAPATSCWDASAAARFRSEFPLFPETSAPPDGNAC